MPTPATRAAAFDLAWKRGVLRTAMALPTPVQRVLAGRRLTLDGQTLAPDTQLMLRLQRLAREPSLESLTILESRQVLLRQTAIAGGAQPIGAVRELPVGDRRGRLYVPTGAASPGPLLVFFHGGGWVSGDLDTHDPACRFLAERSGVRVLSIDYRLAPEEPFPAAYDDALAAYRWVVAHASDLGADPERLGVGGDSAGGTLAATTAIAAAREGLPLALQLLVYPGTDFTRTTESRRLFGEGLFLTSTYMDAVKLAYAPDPETWLAPEASPLLAEIPPGVAPAYVATAGFDPLRDEGEAYARKLADAGVEVELRRFSDQIHGFLNMVGVAGSARAAMTEIAARLGASFD